MQRVSMRTLILLLELLLAVTALQYIALAGPAKAGAVWLAGTGGAPVAAPIADGDPMTP